MPRYERGLIFVKNLAGLTVNNFLDTIVPIVDNKEIKPSSTWFALSLAWQLGYTIAIPIVVFALLGRLLDKKFDTSPWLLLAGILISLIISSIGVYRKTMKILNTNTD